MRKTNIQQFILSSEYATKNEQQIYTQQLYIRGFVDHVQITNYTIGKTRFLINTGINDTFLFSYSNPNPNVTTIILEQGTYSRTQLCLMLQTKMNLFLGTLGAVTVSCYYETTYENGGIYIFSANLPNGNSMSFQFLDPLCRIFNVQPGTYTIALANTKWRSGVLNLQPRTSIFMRSPNVIASYNINNNIQMNDVLYHFADQSQAFFSSYQRIMFTEDHRELLQKPKEQYWNFQFLFMDEDQRFIDMESGSFFIEVQFYHLQHQDPLLFAIGNLENKMSIIEEFIVARFARKGIDDRLVKRLGYETQQLSKIEQQEFQQLEDENI